MAVSTANAVLRRVIGEWRDSLAGVRVCQAAGDVKSSLEDICIDARVGTQALPPSLHALYVRASDQVRRQERGGYPNPFDVAELTKVASEALGQL